MVERFVELGYELQLSLRSSVPSQTFRIPLQHPAGALDRLGVQGVGLTYEQTPSLIEGFVSIRDNVKSVLDGRREGEVLHGELGIGRPHVYGNCEGSDAPL